MPCVRMLLAGRQPQKSSKHGGPMVVPHSDKQQKNHNTSANYLSSLNSNCHSNFSEKRIEPFQSLPNTGTQRTRRMHSKGIPPK
eukprot:6158147-Amphidinium_carterae.1